MRMDVSQNSFNSERVDRGDIVTHILVTLFGISAWIGVNGIFVQLPVLINISPEGWNLPAYIVLVIQSANVGPLFYTLLQHFQCKVSEPLCILCLLILGTFAMGLLSFFYSERTTISGVEYSVVLFILTFFNALIGCFSSVLFMPYLRTFNKVYLVSYFIGEGLSGVLPSVIALIQGIEDNSVCKTEGNSTVVPFISTLVFSPSAYFLFIFVVLFFCLVAFIILQYSSFVQNTKNQYQVSNVVHNETRSNLKFENQRNVTTNFNENIPAKKHSVSERKNERKDILVQHNTMCISIRTKIYLFSLVGICCFFSNGFFPSVQSYSCIPYGNIAYKLSVTFAQFANPFACFLALWLMTSNIKIMNYMFVACLIMGCYVTYLALTSPSPPLQKSALGIALVVISWTVLIGFISYLKLLIVSVFRSMAAPKMLFNVGLIMQVGSASGAILSFLIVNFTDLFKTYDSCALENT